MPILVCALPCEAEPLIQHFSLKLLSNELPFKIYQRDSVQLIVTGVGKVACGAACGYVAGKFSLKDAIWLNVGICGANAEVGTPFLAHKIQDEFYPSFPFPLPCATAPLYTCDAPQSDLKPHLLYDMEGAAFFETAMRFSTLELIHCLKVVSDCGAKILDKKIVSALIQKQIPLIESLLHTLTTLCSHIST